MLQFVILARAHLDVDGTLKCVECHRYLARERIAKHAGADDR